MCMVAILTPVTQIDNANLIFLKLWASATRDSYLFVLADADLAPP